MNKSTLAGLAGALACAFGIAWWWRFAGGEKAMPRMPAPAQNAAPRVPGKTAPARDNNPQPHRPRDPVAAGILSPEEKAARVDRIKRDYDEIRTRASADYSAAGTAFPGGLNAFLRQLALLEREKRADLAAVLSPRELEELELRETTAGHLVQRLLGDTPATEEQRRAVFRLQREFEDRFALTFDLAPRALLERETARQELQERIRGVLGDALFSPWLRGEGGDFAQFSTFVARHGLPAGAALELWRAKNDFTLRRLEIAASRDVSMEQQRAAQTLLARQTEVRVMSIVGPGVLHAARREVLGWLPKR